MELTINTVVYIIAGIAALAISAVAYIYINGGTDQNIASLLGAVSRHIVNG